MCYAIPGRVIELKGDIAVVDYGGVTKDANISLIDKVKVNDYVLIHAGFAIQILNPSIAKESLKITKEIFDNENGIDN